MRSTAKWIGLPASSQMCFFVVLVSPALIASMVYMFTGCTQASWFTCKAKLLISIKRRTTQFQCLYDMPIHNLTINKMNLFIRGKWLILKEIDLVVTEPPKNIDKLMQFGPMIGILWDFYFNMLTIQLISCIQNSKILDTEFTLLISDTNSAVVVIKFSANDALAISELGITLIAALKSIYLVKFNKI